MTVYWSTDHTVWLIFVCSFVSISFMPLFLFYYLFCVWYLINAHSSCLYTFVMLIYWHIVHVIILNFIKCKHEWIYNFSVKLIWVPQSLLLIGRCEQILTFECSSSVVLLTGIHSYCLNILIKSLNVELNDYFQLLLRASSEIMKWIFQVKWVNTTSPAPAACVYIVCQVCVIFGSLFFC